MKTFTLPGTDMVVPNIVLGLMRINSRGGERVRPARVGDGDVVSECGEPPGEVAADVARADDADLHDADSPGLSEVVSCR